MSQVFNFSAGPAMIFPEVLHKAQSELTNWLDQGVSVMEVSHRGKYFMELITQAEKDLRNIYHIPDNYRVLFLQGGARGQFAAIPMNLIGKKGKALYLNSGHWSATAAKEARNFGEIDEITKRVLLNSILVILRNNMTMFTIVRMKLLAELKFLIFLKWEMAY